MKKVSWLLIMCILLIVPLGGCRTDDKTQSSTQETGTPPTEITVFAAASLQDSMTELQKAYEKKHSNVKPTFVFAGSGVLQQQIEQGASADLFISAGKSQMDALEQNGLIVEESRVNLWGNELVLISRNNNTDITSFRNLTDDKVSRIGIGIPSSVPAGQYAQEALTSLKLWNLLQPKLVQAKDATQVLKYVETGNVDAGIVYSSDALGSPKVKVVAVAPESSHEPIVYSGAVISSAKNKEAAEDLLSYLGSTYAQKIFADRGFKVSER